MTTRIVRLSALAAGLFVAAPALASVSPLCGDHEQGKDKTETSKEKTEKKEKDEKKKPTNPA